MILKNKKEKKDSRKRSKIDIVLITIVLLGIIIRVIGIKHGFPFIFHPDEPTIIRSALGIRFDPNPGHFDWPHLYIYLNYFLYMIFAKFRSLITALGFRDKSAVIMPLIWNEDLIYYYLSRCFSAILGGLTSIPIYFAGKKLFGRKAGIFAALAIVLMPYHMWHSHYALGDVPATFLLSWALYFSILVFKNGHIKNYILSGLFIGLSASIKYNGGLSALMVPIAHFSGFFWSRKNSTNEKDRKRIKYIDARAIKSLLLSGFSAFLGFLIGTPYALLDFKTFSSKEYGKGAFWQFENVGSVNFLEHFVNFFTESFGRLLKDTGYVVVPVFFTVLVYFIYKLIKKKMEQKEIFLAFLYVISIFLIWYMSGFKNTRSHYYFVIYPYLAIIFGLFVSSIPEIFEKILKHKVVNLNSSKFEQFLTTLFTLIIFTPLITISAINSYKYHRGDTRNYLHQWLIKNYNPSETLVYNDRALEDIFGNIGIRAYKGLDKFDDFKKSLIVIIDPNSDEREFTDKNNVLLERVVRFDSKFNLGSDIEVYRYFAPEKPSSGCGCGR